jgi:hypothetical protein
MNREANTIGLFGRAADALAAQSTVPLSPGRMIGERVQLCAAAMVVYQAAASTAREKLEAFAEDMVRSGREFILQSAYDYGLDTDLVIRVMKLNDSFAESERSARVTDVLRCQGASASMVG